MSKLAHNGVFSNPDVSRAFHELVETLERIKSLETQGLHLAGVAEQNRARAAEVVDKAKTFERFVKAVTSVR